MRPDHPDPRPRLVRRTEWEWTEDASRGRIVRVWSPTYGQWSRQLPWTGLVHAGLDEGQGFATIVAAVQEAEPGLETERARSRVGTYLYSLWVDGVVDLGFATAPAWFNDRLETKKELGRGGVGVAWLCHDHTDGRPVVVKHAWDFFHPLPAMDRLIRKEAEVFRELDHPGVLRLYDTFERDGLLHMVREFVDGQELHVSLPAGAALDEVTRGLVDLLAHVHASGYLLLDVRPANFFRRAGDGRVVLVDVGNCVRHEGGTVRLKKPMGSPGFSAPEVRKKRQASPASDVYGLGRLLFTLVTGRPPSADWGVEDMRAPLGDHPMAPMILEMCAPEPEKRPSLEDVRARIVA